MKTLTILSVIAFAVVANAKNAAIPEVELKLRKNFVLKLAKGTQVSSNQAEKNWFNLDPEFDEVQGVSANRTYEQFNLPISENTIIVAVIDSGVDVNHEDLAGRIWINPNEIANNGIDDDNNGYIDDINGWNFLGGKDGRHIKEETLEVTRELRKMTKLASERDLTAAEVKYLKKVSLEVTEGKSKAMKGYKNYKGHLDAFIASEKVLKNKLGNIEITLENLRRLESSDQAVVTARDTLLNYLTQDLDKAFLNMATEYFYSQAFYYYNVDFDPRTEIVGDDQNNPREKDYGNNDVIGPDASHGTHVSGIIAATRGNGLGIDGVSTNVKIMALKAVPDGDERDKDVANSIIYAVDNGARIINMSFGKSYSPNKTVVDEAVAYAKSKGVLLVHAAGNSNQNNDTAPNFPESRASNWLEIGASSMTTGIELAADFSNYGKVSVDLFAPGVDILSTTPNNSYDTFSGTSMAAPAVSGVAALILNYKATLTAKTLKTTIMGTTTKYPGLKVNKPGTTTLIPFADLSINGGIANVYSAVNKILDFTK